MVLAPIKASAGDADGRLQVRLFVVSTLDTMQFSFDPAVNTIYEKVSDGERLTFD